MCGGDVSSITWFIVLWAGILVIAIFSKSLIMNIGLIFASVFGYYLSFGLTGEGLSESLKYGIAVMFLCVVGFSIFQILTRVKRI